MPVETAELWTCATAATVTASMDAPPEKDGIGMTTGGGLTGAAEIVEPVASAGLGWPARAATVSAGMSASDLPDTSIRIQTTLGALAGAFTVSGHHSFDSLRVRPATP